MCLGIQKDQVHLQDNGVSGVVAGGDGTALNIICNSDTTAVIETRPGCMFRAGDLQHTGVKNVEGDSTVKLAKLESLKKESLQQQEPKTTKLILKCLTFLQLQWSQRICKVAYLHHSAGRRGNSANQSSWFSSM